MSGQDKVLFRILLAAAAFFIGTGWLMSLRDGPKIINREEACKQATMRLVRVQDAPFPSYVGSAYGEAPGPRYNGLIICDDPHNLTEIKE